MQGSQREMPSPSLARHSFSTNIRKFELPVFWGGMIVCVPLHATPFLYVQVHGNIILQNIFPILFLFVNDIAYKNTTRARPMYCEVKEAESHI